MDPITISVLAPVLGGMMFSIRRAHTRMDELRNDVATKQEMKEKIEDKLESVKVTLAEQKEDIKELKEMLKGMCN